MPIGIERSNDGPCKLPESLAGAEVVRMVHGGIEPGVPHVRTFRLPVDARHEVEVSLRMLVRPGGGRAPWHRMPGDAEVLRGIEAAMEAAGGAGGSAVEAAGWLPEWEARREGGRA